MSEYLFGVERGPQAPRAQRIRRQAARENECTWVYCTIPGTGLQSWFTGRGHGHPFDEQLRKRVLARVAELTKVSR